MCNKITQIYIVTYILHLEFVTIAALGLCCYIITTYLGTYMEYLFQILILGYCWAVVRNLFCSISSLEKKNEDQNGCCSLNYKTGVQIMAGILTIFSAVFLVLNYVKLNEMIEHKFELMFKHDPAWNFEVRSIFWRKNN